MIKTARQLKDLIRNLAKKNSADAQVLLRNYMMERFLERISLSSYSDNFILKGGMLIAAMVGIDSRSTMDLDATIKGTDLSINEIEKMIKDIISVPINDGVIFRIKGFSEIMDDLEYPGVRISMETLFDGTITPVKIDISTGNVITPREIKYSFKLMLEKRFINVWAYNLETVLAEKLETVISRGITNTRMRDFYDLHILYQLHEETLNRENLRKALEATAIKRGSLELMSEAREVFETIEHSSILQQLWINYQDKFSYAKDVAWGDAMKSVIKLHDLCFGDFQGIGVDK